MPAAPVIPAPTSSNPTSPRNLLLGLYQRLKTERSSFDSHWQELADFLQPRRTRFYTGDRNRTGSRYNQRIIDSTARYAARTLGAGLHAGLTSPARPWMKLTVQDPVLRKSLAVKAWLQEVTDAMMILFAQANIYNALPTVYMDLGVFGTGAMAILEDEEDTARAFAYPVGSYVLDFDARGRCNTFILEQQMTVGQIVDMFGAGGKEWANISTSTKQLWEAGQRESSVDVLWCVTPNAKADPEKVGPKFLPWASTWIETGADENKLLRESGFRTFPVMAPRWDVILGDNYGMDCPGMTALGDVKQLQAQQRDKGKAIKKGVDPPLVGSSGLRSQKVSLLPGDITYEDTRDGQKGLRSIHDIALNIDHLVLDMQQVQSRIKRAFHEDLFLMMVESDRLGGGQMTAREVEERHGEKLIVLGPVLERTNDELLDPLVDRCYAIMHAAGKIPDPPPEMDGARFKPEYISVLQQAQKMVGVSTQDRFLSTMQPIIEMFPETRNKINANAVVNTYADMLGVDPSLIRTDDEAQAATDQQAQQAQAAAEAEQAAVMAKAGKDAAATPMGGDTALSRLAASVTG